MSDIYTSAATAACAHFRLGSQASASAEHYAASAWFRAAVDAAYGRGRAEGIAYAIKVILDQAELGEDVAAGDGTKMLFVRGMRHAASCIERMVAAGGGSDA